MRTFFIFATIYSERQSKRQKGTAKMDSKKISDFVDSYGKDVYGFCIYLTKGTLIEPDDLYQEIFLTAMEKASKIDSEKNVKAYLFGIAVKIFKNEHRRYIRKSMSSVSMDDDNALSIKSDDNTEEAYIINEEYSLIRNAVAVLPDMYRLPILLFYNAELSISEIAKILKCPQGTVKRRLFTAKKILKNQLSDADV